MGKKDFGAGVLGAIGIGAVASGAAATYKVSEALIKLRRLHEVAEDHAVFVRLTDRIRRDVAETERLLALREVKIALARNTEKMAWMRGTLESTKKALAAMDKYTGHVRKDLSHSKHVGIINRIRWVLDSHERLINLTLELETSHRGLIEVLSFLSGLEPLACCYDDGHRPRGVPREVGTGLYESAFRQEITTSQQDNQTYAPQVRSSHARSRIRSMI